MDKMQVQDVSQVAKKNKIVMIIAALVFLAFLIVNILRYYELNVHEPVIIFLDVMFLYVIFDRSHPKFITEIDKRCFRVTKKSWYGSKVIEVPYKEIIGVYKYKSSLAHPVSFRRSFTMNSALDSRIVWILAYRTANKKGKMENRRLFIKTSNEMLDALAQKLPNKIRVTEEQVAVDFMKLEPAGKKK